MNKLEIDGIQLDEKPLGQGCSGEVYKGLDQTSDEVLVAKRYNPMAIDRQLMEEMLFLQRNATEHDGIIPLREFRFDKTPYYSLARFEQGKRLMDSYLFDDSQARDLIRDLADTMGHAHQFGLFHGNLHPGNIFYQFDEGLNVKASVGDFAAGMVGDVHYVDLGETAYFAAPEQLQCLGADYKFGNAERWDVYRFGAIAFWIINRTPPRGRGYKEFRAEQIAASGGRPVPVDPLALAESILNEAELAWQPLEAGSQAGRYQDIVNSCLSIKPSDRPRDMQEVTRDIGRLDAEASRKEKVAKRERVKKAKAVRLRKEKEQAELDTAAEAEEKRSRSRLISWFRPRKKRQQGVSELTKKDLA